MTVARKQHTCTLCGLPINPSTEYVYRRVIPWDHPENEGFATYRAHPRCDEVWSRVGMDYDWTWLAPNEFRDELLAAQKQKGDAGP